MKALVVVSHGSSRQASNDEVMKLGKQLEQRLCQDYPVVMTAYLEQVDPSIPAAIKSCVEKGASHILIMPYFLAEGRHVHTDIPKQVSFAAETVPGVNIEILPHLGSSDLMADLMCGLLPAD